MNRTLNLTLSLAVGLLGGLLSRYVSPMPVQAQAQAAAQKEIKAQSFVLVTPQGEQAGSMGFDKDGNASIVLMDKMGKVVWSADTHPKIKPLAATVAR